MTELPVSGRERRELIERMWREAGEAHPACGLFHGPSRRTACVLPAGHGGAHLAFTRAGTVQSWPIWAAVA